MKKLETIRRQWEQIRDSLSERMRRQWAASEVMALGLGGRKLVALATGLAPSTIGIGISELRALARGESSDLITTPNRSRRPGGGRKRLTDKQPGLLEALDKLVAPEARGDPESPLRWVAKSKENITAELVAQGFQVSASSVGKLLLDLGYSLQGNAKVLEGRQHADRDAQFQHIYKQIEEHQQAGNPTLSVDTKKKEIVGNYKNRGQERRPTGEPDKVDVHDFMGELGRASPYGVYDLLANMGWVSVGISADTSEFAVQTLRKFWEQAGRQRYPEAKEWLITADCGGSNGYRVRLWKWELQKLADETGVTITVCHLPPGTSKWNRIEHALFSFISMNWRARPLVDYQTIISLIGATKSNSGLRVECVLDTSIYEKGRKVTDAEMATINLQPHQFHGEWNYSIAPRKGAADGST